MHHLEYVRLIDGMFRKHRRHLQHSLARSFPRVGAEQTEDAVADAFVDACAHPERYTAAWQSGGERRVFRLLRVVAWRRLRGWLRCSATRREHGRSTLPEVSVDAQVEQRTIERQALDRLAALVEPAADATCRRRRSALTAALTERLGGLTDTEAARRHGVPREYVNRARRWMLDRL